MKGIQFTPLKSHVKVSIIALCFGMFAFIGYLIPTPLRSFYDPYARLIDAGVSVALGASVWCVFRLIEPRRHGQNWVIAELTIVPFVWLILLVALVVWFNHLEDAGFRFMDSI